MLIYGFSLKINNFSNKINNFSNWNTALHKALNVNTVTGKHLQNQQGQKLKETWKNSQLFNPNHAEILKME